MFGHAGDGNVHIDVLKGGMGDDAWKKIVPVIKEMIYKTAVSFGGTITGEHGIGYTRKNYLEIALSESEIDLMKRIKNAFDPDNILNPGKIFR
jgi:glycolate oxidase